MGRNIVDASLLPGIISFALLLVAPVFVTTEQDDLPQRARGHERCVYGKDLAPNLVGFPSHFGSLSVGLRLSAFESNLQRLQSRYHGRKYNFRRNTAKK